MKLSLAGSTLVLSHFALLCGAFTQPAANVCSLRQASATATATTSSLDLFGDNKGGGDKKGGGPGMVDQLAMFKKAQEMAAKKAKLDDELKKMDFEGVVEGKVKASFKYVPISNPMDPNPDYEARSFDFDDEFFESATPDEIAEAVKAAILSGIENTNKAVAEKYQVLQEDLMEAFGGGQGGEKK